MIYFTADHHFGHAGAIDQNGRPFINVSEMNCTMIERWNAVVRPADTVHHLGDFAWRTGEVEVLDIFARLNGRKHLVAGNHDHGGPVMDCAWETISQISEVKVDGRRVVLCHYPLLEWRGFHRDAVHLFGHVHGSNPGVGRSCDAGVDCWDFYPITLQQALDRIESRKRPALTASQQRQVDRYTARMRKIATAEKWMTEESMTRTALDTIAHLPPEGRRDLKRLVDFFDEEGWERDAAFQAIGDAVTDVLEKLIQQRLSQKG
jgi:calcineurin-like phosphoesterase family protein